MAITAAREARRLIPSKVATSDFGILALFNFEGTPLNCTLKTEQRREKQGNRGRDTQECVSHLKQQMWKLFLNKGKYNFVKQLLLNLHNSEEN